jgi:hypothetical protein
MSSDTPNIVCLHDLGPKAARHRPDQPQHGRSSPHVLVIFGSPVQRAVCQVRKVTSWDMADQSLSEQAREAVLKAIIKSAPTVGNSPAGIRDLAEAYALLERELVPNAGVVQNKT